jgi:hypothetical protein
MTTFHIELLAWDGATVRDGREARLAERVHINEGTLAPSMLSSAIDDSGPDAQSVSPSSTGSTERGSARSSRGDRPPPTRRSNETSSVPRGSDLSIVSEYPEDEDRVVVLTIQDARSSSAATGGG